MSSDLAARLAASLGVPAALLCVAVHEPLLSISLPGLSLCLRLSCGRCWPALHWPLLLLPLLLLLLVVHLLEILGTQLQGPCRAVGGRVPLLAGSSVAGRSGGLPGHGAVGCNGGLSSRCSSSSSAGWGLEKPWMGCCWEAVGSWSMVPRLERAVSLARLLRLRLNRAPRLAGGAGLVLIRAELRLLFGLQPAVAVSTECSRLGRHELQADPHGPWSLSDIKRSQNPWQSCVCRAAEPVEHSAAGFGSTSSSRGSI